MCRKNWIRVVACAPVLLIALTGCGADQQADPGTATPNSALTVARVDGELPALDPLAGAWDEAPPVLVDLLPQDVMEPRVPAPGPAGLLLQALHDGANVVFRLTWPDDAPDGLVNVDRSSDAVAIQLPATGRDPALPDAMMGESGKPVAIAQWRFSSQERLDGKPHGVKALYPNAATDHYPYEGARDPGIRAEMERRYAPARAAGNPMAARRVTSAVQDLEAEGFGKLAFSAVQASRGRGVHRDGKWYVTITRPLDLQAGAGTRLRPGAGTYIAVAVWNGGKHQSGSKKMRSIWVPLTVEGAAP